MKSSQVLFSKPLLAWRHLQTYQLEFPLDRRNLLLGAACSLSLCLSAACAPISSLPNPGGVSIPSPSGSSSGGGAGLPGGSLPGGGSPGGSAGGSPGAGLPGGSTVPGGSSGGGGSGDPSSYDSPGSSGGLGGGGGAGGGANSGSPGAGSGSGSGDQGSGEQQNGDPDNNDLTWEEVAAGGGGDESLEGDDGWATCNEIANDPATPSADEEVAGSATDSDEFEDALKEIDGEILSEMEIARENAGRGNLGIPTPEEAEASGEGGATTVAARGTPRASRVPAPPPPPRRGESAPDDIPDAKDDDIIARQLREAAMQEQDPVLKEKLWEEYRKYKKG